MPSAACLTKSESTLPKYHHSLRSLNSDLSPFALGIGKSSAILVFAVSNES